MTHHIRVGAEYKTNKESNISLAYTSAFTPDQRGHTVSDGNFATSDNRTKANKQMHNLALDYASPAGLKAGVNYTSYRSESNQDFTNKNREETTSRSQPTSGHNIERL